ncbi:MAG: hypothetical protein ACSHXK_04610 [Oceanococcus sp.]
MSLRALLLAGLALSACNADQSISAADAEVTEQSATDYYADPALSVRQFTIDEGQADAPKAMLVFAPEADGAYPLLQFQHGFTAAVETYSELLGLLAGFGFVVVAPQMYGSDPSSAPSVIDEATVAVEVLAWVQGNLDAILIEQFASSGELVSLDSGKTGLLGHSRGGQAAWRMLFEHAGIDARAIAGVDPVDGDAPPFPPGGTGEMVTDDDGAFQFPFPSLVLGMGLGAQGIPGFECAPENRNYQFFYDVSVAPKYLVVASDYGHSDMVNGDNPNGVCFGALDGSNALLRQFIVGQLAAYFDSVLNQAEAWGVLTLVDDSPVTATAEAVSE